MTIKTVDSLPAESQRRDLKGWVQELRQPRFRPGTGQLRHGKTDAIMLSPLICAGMSCRCAR